MADGPIKLHIGGVEPKPDWKILNARPGPEVDIVGNVLDMAAVASGSVSEIYASHILEHLGYRDELPKALGECLRVLVPGGRLALSVPDFDVLTEIYRDPATSANDQWMAISMIFGGQKNPYDYHKLAATYRLMKQWLVRAGFAEVARHGPFGLFNDSSRTELCGRTISLNMTAMKPAG